MDCPTPPLPNPVRDYFLGHLLRFKGEALLSRLRGIKVRIGFQIESETEIMRFSLNLLDGAIDSVEERWSPTPEVVYRTGEETFWRVVGGWQKAEAAFLRGRIKIHGNLLRGLKLAFLLQEFFDRFPYRLPNHSRCDNPGREEEREFGCFPDGVMEERIQIGEELEIKAAYQEDGRPTLGAILIPPHPFLGGTGDNRLLIELSSTLASIGGFAVRFDYRHPNDGGDEGLLSFWEESDAGDRFGVNELHAVHRWMSEQELLKEVPLAWIGYSYGAQVCLWAMESRAPDKVVLVSPVVSQIQEERFNLHYEALLIGGSEDFATTEIEFERFVQSFSASPRRRMIENADHFYSGKVELLADAVIGFLESPSLAVSGEQP